MPKEINIKTSDPAKALKEFMDNKMGKLPTRKNNLNVVFSKTDFENFFKNLDTWGNKDTKTSYKDVNSIFGDKKQWDALAKKDQALLDFVDLNKKLFFDFDKNAEDAPLKDLSKTPLPDADGNPGLSVMDLNLPAYTYDKQREVLTLKDDYAYELPRNSLAYQAYAEQNKKDQSAKSLPNALKLLSPGINDKAAEKLTGVVADSKSIYRTGKTETGELYVITGNGPENFKAYYGKPDSFKPLEISDSSRERDGGTTYISTKEGVKFFFPISGNAKVNDEVIADEVYVSPPAAPVEGAEPEKTPEKKE